MNKNELKKILRPLIKECVREVIFEEGALSTIVSEVLKGAAAQSVIKENNTPPNRQVDVERAEQKRKQLLEQKRKMLDVIGKDAYNGVDLFEGTSPMSAPRSQSSPQGSRPLDGVSPHDPGVDISGFGMASGIWKKLAGN